MFISTEPEKEAYKVIQTAPYLQTSYVLDSHLYVELFLSWLLYSSCLCKQACKTKFKLTGGKGELSEHTFNLRSRLFVSQNVCKLNVHQEGGVYFVERQDFIAGIHSRLEA